MLEDFQTLHLGEGVLGGRTTLNHLIEVVNSYEPVFAGDSQELLVRAENKRIDVFFLLFESAYYLV